MNSTRDGVCGYVAGGLGNQLFILAAAWEQAERLGCPVSLDVSHYAVNHAHPYGLDAIDHPARKLRPEESPWRSVRINSERVLPFPRRPWGHVFLERDSNRYDPRVSTVKRGTTLLGYFQSAKYFPNVERRLVELMMNTDETESESRIIDEMRSRPAITLHLRRGDYLNVSVDRQFIATVAYAIRSVGLLRLMGVDLPVRVFSDSVDLVKQELGKVEGEFEFVDGRSLGTMATLKAMAAGHAMIMSNSSFSWWAAELMEHQTPNVPVIAPRPWTGAGSAKADMLKPRWVTLDAR